MKATKNFMISKYYLSQTHKQDLCNQVIVIDNVEYKTSYHKKIPSLQCEKALQDHGIAHEYHHKL